MHVTVGVQEIVVTENGDEGTVHGGTVQDSLQLRHPRQHVVAHIELVSDAPGHLVVDLPMQIGVVRVRLEDQHPVCNELADLLIA